MISGYFLNAYTKRKIQSPSDDVATLDLDTLRGQGRNMRSSEWFDEIKGVDTSVITILSETSKRLVNAQFAVLALAQTLLSQKPDLLPPPLPGAIPTEIVIEGSQPARDLQQQLVSMKALVNYAKNPTPKNKSNLPEQYQTRDTVIALETAYKNFETLLKTIQHPEFNLKEHVFAPKNVKALLKTHRHPEFNLKENVLFNNHIDQTFSQDFESGLAKLQQYLQDITNKADRTAAKIVKSTRAQARWDRARAMTSTQAPAFSSVINSAVEQK